MIPYELDPTLHNAEPQEPVLDDGFSRPDGERDPTTDATPAPAGPVLQDKSDF